MSALCVELFVSSTNFRYVAFVKQLFLKLFHKLRRNCKKQYVKHLAKARLDPFKRISVKQTTNVLSANTFNVDPKTAFCRNDARVLCTGL